jgi:VCBS repeat protein
VRRRDFLAVGLAGSAGVIGAGVTSIGIAGEAQTQSVMPSPAESVSTRPILFRAHRLGTDHAESVAIMDMNGDGRPDITSGAYWYENPGPVGGAWKQHKFRDVEITGDYVEDCAEFAIDVNHDGALDIVSSGWDSHAISWYENSRMPDVPWTKHFIVDSEFTEGMVLADIDGDGKPEVIAAHYRPSGLVWISFAGAQPVVHRVGGIEGDGHGVGVADLDGDGKADILTVHGWYKNIDAASDKWQWMPEWNLGETGFPILGYDVNDDGKMDLIYGQGHNYGLYWLEQGTENGKRVWKRHTIDDSYSQVHALALADLDGDELPELIAGKRYRAHNEGDPGADEPVVLYYYKLDRKTATFTRYPISYNGTAGAGTEIQAVDLDGDGDVDIVVGGKTGVHWLENLSINTVSREVRAREWQSMGPWPLPGETE